MIQPSDLGAPAHLGTWRAEQALAFERAASTSKRAHGECLPPGVGKSLIAWALPKLLGARGVIATHSLGLQDQYVDDLQDVGLTDIRGMGRYPCRALMNVMRCDAGPCLDGQSCQWRKGGCSYYDQEERANGSQIAAPNYAWWFAHAGEQPPPLGQRDILVCDEAHLLPDEVCKAAGASFRASEVELDASMAEWSLDDWRYWATEKRDGAKEMLKSHLLTPQQKRELRSLLGRFTRLANAEEDWAIEGTWGEKALPSVRFEPVSAAPYAKRYLFQGIAKLVLLSGTLRRDHLKELGLGDSDFSFAEADCPFPVVRRPIYAMNLGFRLNAHTSAINIAYWLDKLDQVIAKRLHWKGIVHAVSYPRAKQIQRESKYGRYMLIHDERNTREIVEEFKRSAPPRILVSPSVSMGYDFKGGFARWQVVAKVPVPDTRTGLARAKQERDAAWMWKHTCGVLAQQAGRVVRSAQDWGETIIVDDMIHYLWQHYRALFPRWWRAAFQSVEGVPEMTEWAEEKEVAA